MSTVWIGRRGPVVLGPTQHRVAKRLAERTRRGRVTLRTSRLTEELRIERSEVYRITRRLRALGLFGIQDDRSGTRGGRRWWRTAIPHDGAYLRGHRVAWRRIVGLVRAHVSPSPPAGTRRAPGRSGSAAAMGPPSGPIAVPGPTFAERMLRGGLSRELAELWRIR